MGIGKRPTRQIIYIYMYIFIVIENLAKVLTIQIVSVWNAIEREENNIPYHFLPLLKASKECWCPYVFSRVLNASESRNSSLVLFMVGKTECEK